LLDLTGQENSGARKLATSEQLLQAPDCGLPHYRVSRPLLTASSEQIKQNLTDFPMLPAAGNERTMQNG
jgi:hypothetical protein